MGDWTKEFDNSKAALQAFADRVLADARLNLKKKRKPGRTRSGLRAAPRKINASGRLSRSLFWGWSDQKMTLGFGASGKGAKYAYYVEHGRRPGKQPPPRAILQWIKIKPVRPRDLKTGRFIAKTQANLERMAFLIGRKIGRFGTEATHFYSQAFTKHYNKLDRDLQMKFAEDVEEQVDYSLKKLNIKIP
tara:strand:+ start:12 stop:581 length:570 start_codon:yes stop_codon:yes gene_type:complete